MRSKRYTAEEKAWVLEQLSPPVNRTVTEMAQETGITTTSLRNWRNAANAGGVLMPGTGKRQGRWSKRALKPLLGQAATEQATSAAFQDLIAGGKVVVDPNEI